MANTNPLATITVPVPWNEVRASHVEAAVDELLERAQARLDAIHDAPRTYDQTLGALDMATSELDYAMNVASHLEAVDGTAEMRAAYNKILPKVSAFGSKIMLSEPLYRAMRDLAATDEPAKYDPGRARFLKKTLADFRRNGAELDADGKQRLGDIDVALSEQTLKFAQNVVDATAAFELVVEDEKRLAGLPEGAIEAAKASAEEKGKRGWRFTLQAPSYGPVLTYADDRKLRETLYRANVTRASSGEWDNRPVIRDVLALRQEKAKLLGFPHFADLAIDDRMAKTGKDALAFVTMLRDKLAPAFARENEELAAFAKKHGQTEPIAPWDVSYWSEKQRRALYDFDEETLRPYHPLDRLLTGLFEIARDMGAGIEVRPLGDRGGEPVADVLAWHAPLRGANVGGELVPRSIDEIPVLCALAARASGTTRIRDAEELRVVGQQVQATRKSHPSFPLGLAMHGRDGHRAIGPPR